jgi:AraC-like DNA-binding protein
MRPLTESPAGQLAAPDFSVHFAPPPPALQGFVTAVYEVEVVRGEIRDELHPEWFNLRLPLSGDWWGQVSGGPRDILDGPVVQGPTTRLTAFAGRDGILLGVGLMPAGWALLYGGDAAGLANTSRPLEDYLPGIASGAIAQRLHAAPDFAARAAICIESLLARLAAGERCARVERILAVQSAIADPAIATVAQLAEQCGLGLRTLERLCLSAMGFPPKLLLRRQRFLRMLGLMHLRPYQDWPAFLDPHYSDQSHMIRDFRLFLGTTPTGYFARPRPVLQATTAKRLALLGSPMQALASVPGHD